MIFCNVCGKEVSNGKISSCHTGCGAILCGECASQARLCPHCSGDLDYFS